MLYSVYVHTGDEDHAHGVTIPDFPGCFAAADDWSDIPSMVQEAVEVYFEGESMYVPSPTPLEKLARQEEYQGGVWMMLEIDTSSINSKAVCVNVTFPEPLLAQIDAYAHAHHLSRSVFLTQIVEEQEKPGIILGS